MLALRIIQTADEIRRALRLPILPRPLTVALIREPERAGRPVAFATTSDLARALHRDRAGSPLELADAPLLLRGEADARPGVSVWTLTEGGDRHRYLGWAWLDGAGRASLSAALFALQPNPAGV